MISAVSGINYCSNVKNTLNNQGSENRVSFGYIPKSHDRKLLKYLNTVAPSHTEFYNKCIAKNMGKGRLASFMRDTFITAAIEEAKVCKMLFDHPKRVKSVGDIFALESNPVVALNVAIVPKA